MILHITSCYLKLLHITSCYFILLHVISEEDICAIDININIISNALVNHHNKSLNLRKHEQKFKLKI